MILFFGIFLLALNEAPEKNSVRTSSRFPATFEAQISIPVNDGDFVNARKMAVALAMEDVLKQALDHLLEESEKTLNPRTLKKIISNAEQYVKSYNFLYADDNLHEMTEEVGLEITLYSEALRKNLRSLGVLSEPKSVGSVLILIRETGIGSIQDTSFWDYVPISETALIQKFVGAGIPVIPRNALKELVSEKVVLRAIQGDLGAALEIGTQVGVATVILGNAATSKIEQLGNRDPETIQANISVKTISVSKGMVIAAKSDFASAQGESLLEGELQAYEEASVRLSSFLLNSLKQLKDQSAPPTSSAEAPRVAPPPLPLTDL